MGLIQALGSGRIAVDTAPFIYYIEEHPKYLGILQPLFLEAATGARELVTSALTLLEVLAVPFRAGDATLAERYELLLTRSRGLKLVDIDTDQLRAAAQLRARYSLRTPDALQLTAALAQRCSAFVTNDRRIPSLGGLDVIQLDDCG